MNKDQLLKIAKEKYPIGTEYYGTTRDDKNKVTSDHNQIGSLRTVREGLKYYKDYDMITDGYGGAVYQRGIWSIKKGEEEVKEKQTIKIKLNFNKIKCLKN